MFRQLPAHLDEGKTATRWDVSGWPTIQGAGLDSGEHRGEWHQAVFPADHDNAGIGHVPSAGAVGIEIVADRGSFWNTYILIEDGAAHFGVAPNVAVVHDDAAFHQRAGVDAHTAAENRFADESAGKDAAARNDAVERLAAALLFIEDKFGGRIGIAGAADRPLAIVKVELGLDVVQIHVGFVIGLDGSVGHQIAAHS
jgi:hypothetical protein